jgi:hypothetical protein
MLRTNQVYHANNITSSKKANAAHQSRPQRKSPPSSGSTGHYSLRTRRVSESAFIRNCDYTMKLTAGDRCHKWQRGLHGSKTLDTGEICTAFMRKSSESHRPSESEAIQQVSDPLRAVMRKWACVKGFRAVIKTNYASIYINILKQGGLNHEFMGTERAVQNHQR